MQAKLNLYNVSDNWLTRHFTIEYCALFDGLLLPALDRLKLPIPLGGTSNHFRVSALKWLMAWDPFNVTEDADLGMRLARSGYRCQLSSTTYEEAPRRLIGWLRQRTRWLKGYVQTWLVHMRSPRRLWRELGPRGFFAFQIMVGGTVLSALVHPWFYVLVGFELTHGGLLARPESLLGWPFWLIAWFDLLIGYLAAMALGLLAVRRRGIATC